MKYINTYIILSILYIKDLKIVKAASETANNLFKPIDNNAQSQDIKPADAGMSEGTDLLGLVNNILKYLFSFLGFIAVLIAVKAGFDILTSGTEDKRTDAMKTLLNAVIGIVVIIFAYTIVNFVIKGIVSVGEQGATLNP